MAIDFVVNDMKAEEVRQLLINTYADYFLNLGATTLEKNVEWVHVGFANLSSTYGWYPENKNGIYLVNP
jgi:hypothetical protein